MAPTNEAGREETAPAGGRRRQARGRASRERLMAAVLELVDERGFEGATIAELSRRTGLPASSVYWHFPTKDDLVAAALTHSFQHRWRDGTPWPIEPDDRPLVDQLGEALEGLEGDGREADYVRVSLVLALQRDTAAPAAREACLQIRREAHRHLTSWWTHALTRLGAESDPRGPDMLAYATLAALDGRYLTSQDIVLSRRHTHIIASVLASAAQFVATGAPLPIGNQVPAESPAPRSSPPRDLPSRDALVEAAIDVMCDHGYPGTTVVRVCERAGLPASSLYWHFPDLDALLQAAVDAAFDTWQRHMHAELPSAPDRDRDRTAVLTRSLGTGYRGMVTHWAAFRIGFGLLLTRGDSPARDRFRAIRREVVRGRVDWFAEWLAVPPPTGDTLTITVDTLPGQLSWVLMTMADGLFVNQTLSPMAPLGGAIEPIVRGIESFARTTRAGTGSEDDETPVVTEVS